jgi:putative spermidine/putrescine transport system substrate-binding protein/spermidine/putrescine transport system substrate-binding protein
MTPSHATQSPRPAPTTFGKTAHTLFWFAGLALLPLLAGCGGGSEEQKSQAPAELHLFNWNNYVSDAAIQRFEGMCKCKVVQDYYGDNEEMLAKLEAGAQGYDIVVPTSFAVDVLIRQGRVQPWSTASLKNFTNIDPGLLGRGLDSARNIALPYAFTTTILGINKTKLAEVGAKAEGWGLIFDPVQLEKVKGKVTVLDSPRELMAAALLYLGKPATAIDILSLRQAAEVIRKAKPFWAAFNNSSYIKELTLGNIWVAHGYSSDLFQAQRDAKQAGRPFEIDFFVPKEGATLSQDNLVLLKGSPRPDIAHQFADYMLQGEIAAELSNVAGTGNPNTAARLYLQKEVRDNPAVLPDSATKTRLYPLQDIDRDARRALNTIWTEVKL